MPPLAWIDDHTTKLQPSGIPRGKTSPKDKGKATIPMTIPAPTKPMFSPINRLAVVKSADPYRGGKSQRGKRRGFGQGEKPAPKRGVAQRRRTGNTVSAYHTTQNDAG